ncbi:Probable inactive receptor kinase At1g48480 [Linum perenne]
MKTHSRNLISVLCFTLLSLSFLPISTPDLAADRAALLRLRAAVGGRTRSWDVTQQSPCSWRGVTCEKDRVTMLRLPGVALSGELPDGVFSDLTELRTVSLRLNSLSGGLPSDLGSCVHLRNLYLQGNSFSGEIPPEIFELRDLVRLNLGENRFAGKFPAGFDNLTRLKTLYLENNNLTGTIPGGKFSKLEQFNVSNNPLNGSIPSRLRTFDSTSYLGTSLCGSPLEVCPVDEARGTVVIPTSPAATAKSKKKRLSGGAIAGIVIGSLVGLLLIVLILVVLSRKVSRRKKKSMDIATLKPQDLVVAPEKTMSDVENSRGGGYSVAAAAAAAMVGDGKGGGDYNAGDAKKLVFFGKSDRTFDLEDLLRASAEVLGKGTFGSAYKAVLEFGTVVAVKRLRDVNAPEVEFKEKIELVGAMDHHSLVPLKAYYYSRDEKLLVYDYLPMGSLAALLHGNLDAGKTPLNWQTRSSIALGASRGIEYLHSQSPNISHGNIKSSNILLTSDLEPRVSDFGLSSLVSSNSSSYRLTGYRAPEVTDPSKVSHKADIYSFGVLLLELVTGKSPSNEEGIDLPRWVRSVVKDEWRSEVFDVDVMRYGNVEEEMVQMLQLGVDCSEQFPDNRPSITDVTRRIEDIVGSVVSGDRPVKEVAGIVGE